MIVKKLVNPRYNNQVGNRRGAFGGGPEIISKIRPTLGTKLTEEYKKWLKKMKVKKI